MNLTFLCLWNFILFVQYNKSKQNKLKVLSYTDFVFNAYIIIYAGSVFLGHPVHLALNLFKILCFYSRKSIAERHFKNGLRRKIKFLFTQFHLIGSKYGVCCTCSQSFEEFSAR